ncbi:unnamed protein product [Hymenolepis diminuta]|uniref:HTH_48 domain-containing protein n=1 Tax=Hymenolepis diminuta TaxID=6216 RepID=A0A564YSM9_HYMDI|nr:unnamed protein product [Hymenolepis diminuta]
MLKKLNSEQLQVVIDENPTSTIRELSKIFSVSHHMTIYREIERHGWEMGSTWGIRFARNEQATACDLLRFTAFS